MQRSNRLGARALVATAGVVALGVAAAGPLATAAAAATHSESASIVNRTLTVDGTNGADVVSLQSDGTSAFVSFAGDPSVHQFNPADFDTITVSLGNGDDQFTEQSGGIVLSTKAVTVDGGNGNDVIRTGDANDTIFGGNGNDQVDAGRGNDHVFLGNGNDFFVWNPGEGSDAVDGGGGSGDVMQFNGANVNETMSLFANGSSAVFLSDVASIRMDMSNIEVFNLRALGGADHITVDNLRGTSIRHANIDLAGSAGTPDGAADAVTVKGTDKADHVEVTAQDGQVDIAGLQAETRITGSDPTLDHLQLDTLDGNDRVSVDPNVATVIGVGVDLGAGQT